MRVCWICHVLWVSLLNMSCFMDEHVHVCVLDMLCFMGKHVIWVSLLDMSCFMDEHVHVCVHCICHIL